MKKSTKIQLVLMTALLASCRTMIIPESPMTAPPANDPMRDSTMVVAGQTGGRPDGAAGGLPVGATGGLPIGATGGLTVGPAGGLPIGATGGPASGLTNGLSNSPIPDSVLTAPPPEVEASSDYYRSYYMYNVFYNIFSNWVYIPTPVYRKGLIIPTMHPVTRRGFGGTSFRVSS